MLIEWVRDKDEYQEAAISESLREREREIRKASSVLSFIEALCHRLFFAQVRRPRDTETLSSSVGWDSVPNKACFK